MKKLALPIVISLFLTSCGGYETLKTPFTFRGDEKAVEKLHITEEGKKYAKGAPIIDGFEVEVKAPAGTPMDTAYSIFDKEARRICNQDKYQYQITSQDKTASGMQPNYDDKGNAKFHYLTGVVVCGASQAAQPDNRRPANDDITREGNVVSGALRGRNYKGADIRGASIQGRTMGNTAPMGVSQQEINAVLNPEPVQVQNIR